MANSIETQGDISVGRNASVGGKMVVQGNATVNHNLNIKGWLDAPNIKGANKGIFGSTAALNTAYPNPEAGWFAGVIVNGHVKLFQESGGTWENSGQDIEFSTDFNDIEVYTASQNMSDLDIADEEGNVILRLKDGHIRTSQFDSSDIKDYPIDVQFSDDGADLNITDENGNTLVQCKNGHIKTKYFDSSNIESLAAIGNYYIDCTNGKEVPNNSYKSTDFIKIEPGEKFRIPVFSVVSLSVIGLAFYDEQKQYIHGIPYPYIAPSGYNSERYIAPDSAMYVRYTLQIDQKPYIYNESNYPVAPYFRLYKAAASVENYKGRFKVFMNFGNGVMLATSGVNKGSHDDVHIYRSSDWGSTWTLMGNATEDLGLEEGLYYGDHNGQGLAIIGSGDLGRHYLLRVTNYGAKWDEDYEIVLKADDIDALVGVSTNGCENVIYCGDSTFRALCNSSSNMGGGAVIETTDNGDNWSIPNTQNPLMASVRSIYRTAKGVIWAVGMKNSTHQGVWKSSDNGLNWEKKSTFLAFQSIIEHRGNLYCGAMNSNTSQAYVYMSKDDGDTWEKVLDVDEGWNYIYHRTFIPYGNMLAAVFCEGEGSTASNTVLYVTSNDGKSWGKIESGREGCYDGGLVNLDEQIGNTLILHCNNGLFKM